MARQSQIPQQLKTGALLHFESGVPISDVDVREENRDRLVRVDHVYWLWKKNPMLDTFQLFRQLIRQTGRYAGVTSEYSAAQKDQWLFEFVRDMVMGFSRKQDEAVVRMAAHQAIRIGMETDNVVALTKGGKLLYDVAGLNRPEEERNDMSKVAFLPSVVVTNIREVDDSKQEITDEETNRIIAKYGAYVDGKHKAVDDKVAVMEARSMAQDLTDQDDEQDRDQSEY